MWCRDQGGVSPCEGDSNDSAMSCDDGFDEELAYLAKQVTTVSSCELSKAIFINPCADVGGVESRSQTEQDAILLLS